MTVASAPGAASTRAIGPWTAVALVMGNMIGSGIFLLPASLAPYGGIALAAWILSAAGSMLLALVFARLGRLNPAAGGLYAYTRLAFGDLAGFLIGWGYMGSHAGRRWPRSPSRSSATSIPSCRRW